MSLSHTCTDAPMTCPPPPPCNSIIVPSIDRPACSLKESFLIRVGIWSLALQAPLSHSERVISPPPSPRTNPPFLLNRPERSGEPTKGEQGLAISKDMFEERRERKNGRIKEKGRADLRYKKASFEVLETFVYFFFFFCCYTLAPPSKTGSSTRNLPPPPPLPLSLSFLFSLLFIRYCSLTPENAFVSVLKSSISSAAALMY